MGFVLSRDAENLYQNIYVTGIVSAYDESEMPVGLCKAKELYYVTAADGPYDPTFSYGYIESLSNRMYDSGQRIIGTI